MKLIIQLGGVLMAFVMLLAACTPAAQPTATPGATPADSPAATPTGGPTAAPTDAPTDAPVESPGEPTPEPTPTPPPGATEGTLVIWADADRAPVIEAMGQQFTAEHTVPVQVYQLDFGAIRDHLSLYGPSNVGPDLIIGAHDWVGQLAEAGVIDPIDLSTVADNFDPVALQAFTHQGELYGMPYATEAIALYYNADLVTTPPTTWTELKETALALQNDPDSGVEQGYCLQQADPYHSYPILTGSGGYLFDEDANGEYLTSEVGLDSEGGLAYAQEIADMIDQGILRADIGYGECLYMMTRVKPDWLPEDAPDRGGAAFWITGPWALADFENSGVNFGVAPIPSFDGAETRPFLGAQGFMLSRYAANPLLAQTFLTEFMASDEAMTQLYEVGRRPPAWIPSAEQVTDENVQQFIAAGANADPMPKIPEMNAIFDAWGTMLTVLFNQQQDPEEAIRDLAETVRDAVGATP